jgi:Glycosyltransferase family 87
VTTYGVLKFVSERFGFVVTAIIFTVAELASFQIAANLFRRFHTGWTFHLPADLQCFVTHGAFALGQVHAVPIGMEPFMYPPPILLLGAPLSFLPTGIAYGLWSCFGAGLLCLAGLQLKMPPLMVFCAVLLPPSLYCLILGESGLIPASLLILSLYWVRRRPVFSGVIAGLMILKPQNALLLPICYLASRQPRAILAAAASTLAICALTLLFFGVQPWLYFFHISMPEARQVLQAPWHQNYQNLMTSPFILLRSLGAALPLAYAVQFMLTLSACWLTWRLWRPPGEPGLEVILITACLAAIATPYGYIYDLPGIGLLLLATWPRHGWKLAAAWCFILGTGCYAAISVLSFSIGALLTAGLCLTYWLAKRESSRRSRSGLFHSGSQR